MVEDVGGSKVKKNEKVGPPTAGNRAPAPYTQGASASRWNLDFRADHAKQITRRGW